MSLLRSRAFIFSIQFLPLFLLFLWLYPMVLHLYQPAMIKGANILLGHSEPPMGMESNDKAEMRAFVESPMIGRLYFRTWNRTTTHMIFLSLIFLPALLMTTPIRIASRVRDLLLGMSVLALVHVWTLVIMVKGTYCLQKEPDTFLCLWILRMVYTSGQLSGVAIWVLLSWSFWFPRKKNGDS